MLNSITYRVGVGTRIAFIINYITKDIRYNIDFIINNLPYIEI